MGGKGLKGIGLPLLDSLLLVKGRRERTVSCEGRQVCHEHSVSVPGQSSVLAVAGMNITPAGGISSGCVAGLL